MEISTSRGAILHKPDWNLHKPGSDSPQARSPRATHPPRFVPKTFSFAYPTFSFAHPTFRKPLPTFRKPGNVSSAAKASRAGEMRRTGKFDSRRFPSTPVDSAPRARTPAASRRPPRRFHRNRPTVMKYHAPDDPTVSAKGRGRTPCAPSPAQPPTLAETGAGAVGRGLDGTMPLHRMDPVSETFQNSKNTAIA